MFYEEEDSGLMENKATYASLASTPSFLHRGRCYPTCTDQAEANEAEGLTRASEGSALLSPVRARGNKSLLVRLLVQEEDTMKEILRNAILKNVRRAAVAMLAIGIAAGSAVHAKPKPKKMADKPANVVAHVQLSGGPVTRMLLVKEEGKEFLLLGLDSSSNVAIVDVTEPAHAHIIETSAGAPAAELRVVAGALTAFGTSEGQMAAASEPKEIRSFSGVTTFINDNHGLIYLVKGDGLWIVKTKQRAAADADFDPSANYYAGGG